MRRFVEFVIPAQAGIQQRKISVKRIRTHPVLSTHTLAFFGGKKLQ